MPIGKLYINTKSKLYITAVIAAFTFIVFRVSVSLVAGHTIVCTMPTFSGNLYLGFVQLAAELFIPISLILARKNIKFLTIANIALIFFQLIYIFDAIADNGAGNAGEYFLVSLSLPFALIIPFLINGLPLTYILQGARSRTTFTVIVAISTSLYLLSCAFGSSHYYYLERGSFAYVFAYVIGPTFMLISLVGGYICLGLSLLNKEPTPEEIKEYYKTHPVYPSQNQQYIPYPQYTQHPQDMRYAQYPQYPQAPQNPIYQPYPPMQPIAQQPVPMQPMVQQPVPMQNNAQDMAQSTEQNNDQN